MHHLTPRLQRACVFASSLAIAGAACGGSGTPRPPGATKVCTNTAVGFAIEYPADWFTTQRRPADACARFDPERFTIPFDANLATADVPTAVMILARVGSYGEVLLTSTNAKDEKVIARADVTVAGRPAVRVEVEQTADKELTPKGTRVYFTIVDRDGFAYVVVVVGKPGEDERYARYRAVLDRMVPTLRFL